MTTAPSKRALLAALLATSMLGGIAGEAFAQIEEIVVTTRKRAENLQDVPIVVTAFTAENLERKGIGTLQDVLKYTPGVQINEAFVPQDQRVTIRGLSPTRGRPNVAVLQDDIDISSEALQSAGGSLLINPRLFDMERVEIVKGPHSALYGRSAFAGAINYITKKPGDEFEAKVSVEAGMRGRAEVKASASGPIEGTGLSVGANAAYWNFEGFHKNALTNKRLGGYEGQGLAATAVWNNSDMVKITGRVEYTDDSADPLARGVIKPNLNEAVPANVRTDVSAAAGGSPATRGFLVSPVLTTFPIVDGGIPDRRSVNLVANVSPNPRTPGVDYPGVDREIFRATLRVDAQFSMVDFTSLTHYGRGDTQQFLELANTGDIRNLPVAQEINFDTLTRLVSQELRLQSNDDESPLQWTAGGLYWNENANQLSASLTCFTTFPQRIGALTIPAGNPADNCGRYVSQVGVTLPNNPENWGRNTFHSSIYAMAEYDITEQFAINVEIRRTWEREHTKGPTFTHSIDPYGIIGPGPAPAGCSPVPPATTQPRCFTREAGSTIGALRTEKYWTPRVGLNFQVNDDLLLYASVAEGIKPGGISTLGGGNQGFVRENLEYEREKMWVYEGGWKSNFLDGKALLNGAAFYQDFTDKQASTQIVLPNGTLGTRIVNAASARVYGVDLESAYQPTDQLSLSLGYSWLDAKYKDFVVRTGGANPIVRSQNCTPVVTYRLPDGSSRTVVNPTALPAPGAVIAARTCDVDKSGHKLEFAPTHSLQLNVLFRQDIGGDMSWVSEFSAQAQSKRYADDDQRSFLQGFWSADIRSGVEADSWAVTAYVDNVFNDDTIKAGLANTDFPGLSAIIVPGPFTLVLPSNFTANLPDKRQFGVRASYKF
ncbi:MAG: TonB-dependent receptor [Rhodospirillaceae bacterium]|nr:TonB-dependent receptor [Rhodospirillaceae bacterium]